MVDGAGEEAAGAAGGVEHDLVGLRVELVDDELGHGARGVELAGVAGALQVAQNLLVDAAEGVAVFGVVEVDLADLVDHLPHERAGLHVVVGILKHAAHHKGRRRGGVLVDILQGREEHAVDEFLQLVAGHAFRVLAPSCASAGVGAAAIGSCLRAVPVRLRGRRKS